MSLYLASKSIAIRPNRWIGTLNVSFFFFWLNKKEKVIGLVFLMSIE